MNIGISMLAVFMAVGLSFAQIIPVPEKLEVYGNQTFLTEKINSDKSQTVILLPFKKNFESINPSIYPENCFISSIEETKVQKPKQLEIYKEKLKSLQIYLETLNVELSILEKSAFTKNIQKSLDEFEKIYFDKLQKRNITQKEIKKLEEKIKKMEKNYINPLKVKVNCQKRYTLRISLPVDIKAYQEYLIKAYTLNKKIFLFNRISLQNNTSEELNDINLIYYTYKKTTSIQPPPFERPYPIYMPEKIPLKMQEGIQREYTETETKTFYSVKNVSIPANKGKKIVVSKDIYDAKFDVFIDGYATVTPFLRAEFTVNKLYPASFNAFYYVDGVYIGRGRFSTISPGKNRIYLGEDVFVDVKKILLKDFTEETFFGKKITTKKWKYILKNRHKHKIKITLTDKVPVSKSEKIKIEPFSTIKWKEIKPNGMVVWEFYIKPNAILEFEFGYKIERKK